MKKKLAKALLYLMTGGLAFFVVTFTVYFFNLDMKLTSMIEPLLLKWYDRIPRNQQPLLLKWYDRIPRNQHL